MTTAELDARTALVIIDLQKGVVGLTTVRLANEVVVKTSQLAQAFREAGLPVVAVNVAFSPDGADMLRPRADATSPVRAMSPDYSELAPELHIQPGDLRVTKRQWDAFYGTDLDLQLRRRAVTGIVLTGISTSIGVESTARSAHSRGYNVTFAEDAMTDTKEVSHRHSVEHIFPRIGQVRATEEILAALHPIR